MIGKINMYFHDFLNRWLLSVLFLLAGVSAHGQVSSWSDFSDNGGIYTMQTARGYIYWNGTSSKLSVKSGNPTPSNIKHQFLVLKFTTDNVLLYNIGAGKFVYENRDNAALSDEGNECWKIKQSTKSSYPLMLDATNSTDHWNVDNTPAIKVDGWSTEDSGNRFAFTHIKDIDEATLNSIVEKITYPVPLPEISVSDDGQVTLSHNVSGSKIYYTTDGTEPTTQSSLYSTPFQVSPGTKVQAIAVWYGNMSASSQAYYFPSPGTTVTEITSLDEITNAGGNYKLKNDVQGKTLITPFYGKLDGDGHTVSGLSAPLFSQICNAVICNLNLEDVDISSGSDVGALAGLAYGNTRIYNCGVLSGSVSGTGSVGSLVGVLKGSARVINCFSYADVSGGTNAAGIVGTCSGTPADKSTAFTQSGYLVMNCIYWGKATGSNVYPVYGGANIDNVSGLNTYNYFLYRNDVTYTSVNSAAGVIDDSYFNRFDIYKGIMNAHRDLASMYVFGDETVDENHKYQMAFWYHDKENKGNVPYLRLKAWPRNTRKTLDRTIPSVTDDFSGKQVGTLQATFIINGTSFTETLPITDMNKATWDYTWGKVVLPFANEFTGWSMPASGSTAYDNVVTGWEITSITGGTTTDGWNKYNLCDPNDTNKDLYATNNYVWAQGGNYVVPNGVTAITFTAHIVKAVYLCNKYPDIAYDGLYSSNVTNIGKEVSDVYNGKTVYHTMNEAIAQLDSKTNPADQAIVLVGNYDMNQNVEAVLFTDAYYNANSINKALTIMSNDADCNQEPDYYFPVYNSSGSGRSNCPPLRFDFVDCPGLGITTFTRAGYLPDFSIIHSNGWFECTETFSGRFTEFEIRPMRFMQASPLILNGGIFDQIIQSSTKEYNQGGNNNNLQYIKIGGRAYVMSFVPGFQSSNVSLTLSGKPVNVSGGEFDMLSLSGKILNQSISGDVNLYCNGGYIHEFTSALQEKITGNVNIEMHHALIDEFYGGGSVDYGNEAQITGSITTNINDSYVKQFCGGPKFGSISLGQNVTTTANRCTFESYYGGGYGGTALKEVSLSSSSPFFGSADQNFGQPFSAFYTRYLTYDSDHDGYLVSPSFKFFMYAGGSHRGNEVLNGQYASLSLASTYGNTSTLTDCHILGDFYGGGCQGMVDGAISNKLTNCTVNGNVYGGGYRASSTPIYVYSGTESDYTFSVFRASEGYFTPFVLPEPEVYTWVYGTRNIVNTTDKTMESPVNFGNIGKVTGVISTNVLGGSAGNVFGGGNESESQNNTEVEITDATITGNVFGGGNKAKVGKNTTVRILGSTTVEQNVYGGGNEAEVGGTTTVQIGEECVTTSTNSENGGE